MFTSSYGTRIFLFGNSCLWSIWCFLC